MAPRCLIVVLAALAVAAPAVARVAPRPADQTLATRLVVSRADVGGAYDAYPSPRGLSHCTPLDRHAIVTGIAHGPTLVALDAQVASAATVYATPGEARAAFGRAARGSRSACAEDAIGRAATVLGSDFRVVGRGTEPLRGLPGRALVNRIAFTVEGDDGRTHASYDAVVVHRGRSVAVAAVLSVGRPPDSGFERRLAARVLGRAR